MDENEESDTLLHKLPFKPLLQEDGPPIVSRSREFSLEAVLQNMCSDSTPPPSPDFDHLFSLSPLSSPEDDGDVEPFSLSSPCLPSQTNEEACLPPLGFLNPMPPHYPFTPAKPSLDTNDALPDGPQASTTEAAAPSARKRRRRARNHQNRREGRQVAHERSFSHYEKRPNMQKAAAGSTIQTTLATEDCSAAAGAFVGLNDASGRKKVYELASFVGVGSKQFDYVAWDGKIRRSVADAHGRKVAFLAGQPLEQDWSRLIQEAADALESRRSQLSVSKDERIHRRGAFPAIRSGVSHGGGSTQPVNMRNESPNAAVVEELRNMEAFKRFAGFASSVMSCQAPKLFEYYLHHLAELHKRHPHLKRLFPSSIFAAASFNFGPRTACFKHKDSANLPFGLCAITALGNFDPRKGGHLVLWELKLIIEFPAGATILLPSAIISHSNTPVRRDERRYSFAQYTAGGIFRWVQNDFKLTKDFYASLSPDELENEQRKNAERWQLGLSFFEKAS